MRVRRTSRIAKIAFSSSTIWKPCSAIGRTHDGSYLASGKSVNHGAALRANMELMNQIGAEFRKPTDRADHDRVAGLVKTYWKGGHSAKPVRILGAVRQVVTIQQSGSPTASVRSATTFSAFIFTAHFRYFFRRQPRVVRRSVLQAKRRSTSSACPIFVSSS